MLHRTLLSLPIILSLLLGSSCKKDKDKAHWEKYSRESIERIINRPVLIPNSGLIYFPDSISFDRIMRSSVKVLFSVDISCSVCLSKFNYWNDFINRLERKRGIAVPVLAVISADRYDENTQSIISSLWSREWIYDSNKDFIFNNDLEDDRFQAILLDANNTIRLVGNPVFNEALGKLYETTIVDSLR